MQQLWFAIVLQVWFAKSRDELGRYGYRNDETGFVEAMGLTDKCAWESFKLAWS